MVKRQHSPDLAEPIRARTSSKSPKPEEAKSEKDFSKFKELWSMKPEEYNLHVEAVVKSYREQDPSKEYASAALYRGPVPDVFTVIPNPAKQTNRLQMFIRLAIEAGQDEIPEDGVAWFFNDDNKVPREDADGKPWPENRIKVLDALDALIAVKPLTPPKKEGWELFFNNEFYFSPDQSSFYTEYLDFICNPAKHV